LPRLFSYGSLQQAEVQRATFGRLLIGQRDELPGFELQNILHGAKPLSNARRSAGGCVPGTVFDVSQPELLAADAYERADSYVRQAVTLASGIEAWVYVDSATTE
jgi:gamma-glutamylcyclotransferase (GGCT)/AIG2-like uncharacterized protein YtfP